MRGIFSFATVSRILLAIGLRGCRKHSAGPDAVSNEASGQAWWAHVRYLADDSMKGRLTGSDEYVKVLVLYAVKETIMGILGTGA